MQDPTHQAWLDDFWTDPINRLDLRLPTWVRELSLFGELCLPAFTNQVSGALRLGYLDPELIEDVLTDPDNPGQEIGIRTVADAAGKRRNFRTILRGVDEELFAAAAVAARAGYTDGECFYYSINRLAGGRRGRSDLLAQLDFLDAYDEFVFDELERASDLDAYVWDVKITGADKTEIDERAKKIERPARGSVRVHNEQEEWKAEAPSLNAADRTEIARLFRNHALGGATVPEHWFGGGGDVNRAVGGEMADPFVKVATSRQTVLRHMLQDIGAQVLLRRAQAEGQTPDWSKPEWKVQAIFPELSTRDVAKLASALQSVVAAAAGAVNQNLLSKKTALSLIAVAAARLEVEIDVEAELTAALAERPAEDETAGGLGVPTGLEAQPGQTSPDDAPPQPGA